MNEKHEIIKYTASHQKPFKELLGRCFNQDYNIPLDEHQLDELCNEITGRANEEITFLDLLILNDDTKGFIIYQIDTPQSDWCERETWGCIRELYVSPDSRSKGYGIELAKHAENKLWEQHVPNIYLTADDAVGFWIKMGYRDTGDICDKNSSHILEK